MITSLDLPGLAITNLDLKLPDDTKEALREQGIEPPDFVRLELREATPREKKAFERDQQKGGRAEKDTYNWLTSLLMRRAGPGTDERVVSELLLDMTDTLTASLTYAYLKGELPDPKVIGPLVAKTRNGLTNLVMKAVAGALPSTPTSTAFIPGT